MEWIKTLYSETHDLWKRSGENSAGYAIFYSPVRANPQLMIIGYNPGGDSASFEVPPTEPPKEHDYIVNNYPLAIRIRNMFESAGIRPVLERSVKTNLYYFRSKSAADLKQHSIEERNFFRNWTKQIIDRLKPQNILVEGFETFTELTKLLNVKTNSQEEADNKAIMLFAEYDGIKLIGIPHPTGGQGYTGANWKKITEMLTQVLHI